MRWAVLLALLPAAGFAQPAAPALPPRVCVPVALMEKLIANTVRQPWEGVSAVMDEVRTAARGFTPCGTEPPFVLSAPATSPAPDTAPSTVR